MNVTLNGTPLKNFDPKLPTDLEELLDQVVAAAELTEDDIFIEILMDGKSYDAADDELSEVQIKAGSVQELALRTSSVVALLQESIDDGAASFEVIAEASRESAARFRSGQLADALEYFAELMERIQVTMEYWMELRAHLEALDVPEVAEMDDAQEHLRGALAEAVEFQQNSDWVMLADMAENEFPEIFIRFREILSLTKDRIA